MFIDIIKETKLPQSEQFSSKNDNIVRQLTCHCGPLTEHVNAPSMTSNATFGADSAT
jgi:hypothetical protein